jgi:hypothetical protein
VELYRHSTIRLHDMYGNNLTFTFRRLKFAMGHFKTQKENNVAAFLSLLFMVPIITSSCVGSNVLLHQHFPKYLLLLLLLLRNDNHSYKSTYLGNANS